MAIVNCRVACPRSHQHAHAKPLRIFANVGMSGFARACYPPIVGLLPQSAALHRRASAPGSAGGNVECDPRTFLCAEKPPAEPGADGRCHGRASGGMPWFASTCSREATTLCRERGHV